MQYIPNILFFLLLAAGVGYFTKNIRTVIRNIKLGIPVAINDHKKERYGNVARIALGQSKLLKRPISGALHAIVYLGFIIINIEVLEIIIDGLLGTHRIFAFLGGFYDFLIGTFEILALLVLVSVVLFWTRRNVLKIKRFLSPEMKGWPKQDGNIILYFEVVLMGLFLIMNSSDYALQQMGAAHYIQAGSYPVSSLFAGIFDGMSQSSLIVIERTAWWLHITGILIFLNYLYFSKHLHILLAFPNVYFGAVTPKGQFKNNQAVTAEVKMMMDPSADPFAAPAPDAPPPAKFGASDVMDLSQVQLLNAYTCTECGRCTSECPANQTGKKLSPRKIMMDTRDRLQEVSKNIDANAGVFVPDGKELLKDYLFVRFRLC